MGREITGTNDILIAPGIEVFAFIEVRSAPCEFTGGRVIAGPIGSAGDIGVIEEINNEELTCVVSFFPDHRIVEYNRDDIPELDLSYAITIHKSQGSEFGAVIIPVLTQHFKMLFRNLIYTGLTRARKLAVLVGTRKALAMAVKNQDTSQRQTYLKELL